MRKLAKLIAGLERNSLLKPQNIRVLLRGQNPLAEPSLKKVYPPIRPKRKQVIRDGKK
jgi:hypothetical protein